MFKVNNKVTITYITPFSSDSIVDFENIFVCCVGKGDFNNSPQPKTSLSSNLSNTQEFTEAVTALVKSF